MQNEIKTIQRKYRIAVVILSIILCGLVVSVLMVHINSYWSGRIEGYKEGLADGKRIWMFAFYYAPPLKTERKYGLDVLENDLKLTWVKEWKAGVFDCSEMSAFLERYLEIEGWHTYIAVGKNPTGAGNHSWLIVEVYSGKYIPVEATTIEIVYPTNPYYDNYFSFDYVFDTIQEALNYSSTEFDWWEGD